MSLHEKFERLGIIFKDLSKEEQHTLLDLADREAHGHLLSFDEMRVQNIIEKYKDEVPFVLTFTPTLRLRQVLANRSAAVIYIIWRSWHLLGKAETTWLCMAALETAKLIDESPYTDGQQSLFNNEKIPDEVIAKWANCFLVESPFYSHNQETFDFFKKRIVPYLLGEKPFRIYLKGEGEYIEWSKDIRGEIVRRIRSPSRQGNREWIVDRQQRRIESDSDGE